MFFPEDPFILAFRSREILDDIRSNVNISRGKLDAIMKLEMEDETKMISDLIFQMEPLFYRAVKLVDLAKEGTNVITDLNIS